MCLLTIVVYLMGLRVRVRGFGYEGGRPREGRFFGLCVEVEMELEESENTLGRSSSKEYHKNKYRFRRSDDY